MYCFRLFAAALLAAALFHPAQAQTAAPGDSTRLYKHQLGLTVSPQFGNLFTSNRVLPLGLLYKHQLRPGRAWRVRLTGYYSRHDTASAGGGFYIQDKGPTARVWEVNVLAGYEWQHRLGRRWQWHYGLEAGVGYRHEHRDYINYLYNPIGFNGGGAYNEIDTGFSDFYRWQLQARVFAGLSYALTARVSVFAETAFALSYRHQNGGGSYTSAIDNPNYGIGPGGAHPDSSINTLNISYQPVQVLGLSVRF